MLAKGLEGLQVVLHGVPRASRGKALLLSPELVKIPSSQALRHENGLLSHISLESHMLLAIEIDAKRGSRRLENTCAALFRRPLLDSAAGQPPAGSSCSRSPWVSLLRGSRGSESSPSRRGKASKCPPGDANAEWDSMGLLRVIVADELAWDVHEIRLGPKLSQVASR